MENINLYDKLASVIEQMKQENVKTNVLRSYSGVVERKLVVEEQRKVGAKQETNQFADIVLSPMK